MRFQIHPDSPDWNSFISETKAKAVIDQIFLKISSQLCLTFIF